MHPLHQRSTPESQNPNAAGLFPSAWSVGPPYGKPEEWRTDRKLLPSAPATAFIHIGNGTNFICVDPKHHLVAVVRWIENSAMDGTVKRILLAFPK